MADIKFSEFPKATTSKDSDKIAILQDGVNKMIPSPVLESKIINKTVSMVIEQGGASLNVINLKGVVPTYADLATITPTPDLNDAYQVEADGLVYVYTENGFQADGDGFVVQAEPIGVVEEGNTQAVSGGEVFNTSALKNEVGIDSFIIGQNIAPELSNSNFNDSLIWGSGMYNDQGVVVPHGSTMYTKNKYKIVAGTYTCNLQLGTNNMSVVLFDRNGVFVKAYRNKEPNTVWEIIADVDGFIAFSKLTSLATLNNYCITNQAFVGDTTSKVFVKSNELNDLVNKGVKGRFTPFIFNITKNGFDYRAIKSIRLISGNESMLKDSSGNWLRLFLSFVRITNFDSVASTIVQVAKWNDSTGTVGNGNISVSSYNGNASTDNRGFLTVITSPINESGLIFKIILDTNYLRQGTDTSVNLLGGIELNTSYLFGSSDVLMNIVNINISLGDSLTEFRNIPYNIGLNLNTTFLNAGIGGTRMGFHENTVYGELSFYKIAESINSGNFTAVNTAIDTIIPTVSVPRQQRLLTTKNNLNNTDYSKVANMTVWFGTNDFTANNPIGAVSLDNFDTTTVVGAFNYGIDKILSEYPQIKIYVITPMFRYVNSISEVNNSDFYENTLGLKVIDYVNAIVEIANMNHLPVKNMYTESGLNKYNHSLYYEDTTHTNALGATYCGMLLGRFINSKNTI